MAAKKKGKKSTIRTHRTAARKTAAHKTTHRKAARKHKSRKKSSERPVSVLIHFYKKAAKKNAGLKRLIESRGGKVD